MALLTVVAQLAFYVSVIIDVPSPQVLIDNIDKYQTHIQYVLRYIIVNNMIVVF